MRTKNEDLEQLVKLMEARHLLENAMQAIDDTHYSAASDLLSLSHDIIQSIIEEKKDGV